MALWINPNVEFFGLDDIMPGTNNERVPRDQAHVPNVRNWSVRDYGNRVGVWRLMETLTRHGMRGTAALNSDGLGNRSALSGLRLCPGDVVNDD